MPDMPDITNPYPRLVAKEVTEILGEYGPAMTPEDYERLANGADHNPTAYDGGPELARAVAAELRRRADDMRRGILGSLL